MEWNSREFQIVPFCNSELEFRTTPIPRKYIITGIISSLKIKMKSGESFPYYYYITGIHRPLTYDIPLEIFVTILESY